MTFFLRTRENIFRRNKFSLTQTEVLMQNILENDYSNIKSADYLKEYKENCSFKRILKSI